MNWVLFHKAFVGARRVPAAGKALVHLLNPASGPFSMYTDVTAKVVLNLSVSDISEIQPSMHTKFRKDAHEHTGPLCQTE